MPKRTIALLALSSVGSFVLGVVLCLWLVVPRIVNKLDNATDALLADRTLILQELRHGNSAFVERHVESTVWSQLVGMGNRRERGETLSPSVVNAIAYHCAQFEQQKGALSSELAKHHGYWCAQLSK